jgi:hypothetical protein
VKLSKGKRLKPVLLARIQLLFIGVYFLVASQHQFGLEQKAMGLPPCNPIVIL